MYLVKCVKCVASVCSGDLHGVPRLSSSAPGDFRRLVPGPP